MNGKRILFHQPMDEFNYHGIDEVISSPIRTAILAVLITTEEAEFTFIRDKVGATDGNISVHLRKLEDHKYVAMKKRFVGRKPVTSYRITGIGREAFEKYINKLEKIIKNK